MSQLEELLELADTKNIPHGKNRTLYDHLVRTYNILRLLNADNRVALAGLFHSIYGTTVFKKQALTEDYRPIVESVIGTYAENLVWLFCKARRPFQLIRVNKSVYIKTTEGDIEVTPSEVEDLTLISAINSVEQKNYRQKQNATIPRTVRK